MTSNRIGTRFNTKSKSNPYYPLEYTDDEFYKRPENDIIIQNLSDRLKSKYIKRASIISYCEEIDLNNDGIIHINDLEIILNHFLTDDKLNIREKKQLFKYLYDKKNPDSGTINYMKLLSLFPDTFDRKGDNDHVERWYDDGYSKDPNNQYHHHHHHHRNDNNYGKDYKWAVQKGSLGEFLKDAACPSEISNFHVFISCMEDYERRTGI